MEEPHSSNLKFTGNATFEKQCHNFLNMLVVQSFHQTILYLASMHPCSNFISHSAVATAREAILTIDYTVLSLNGTGNFISRQWRWCKLYMHQIMLNLACMELASSSATLRLATLDKSFVYGGHVLCSIL